MNWYEITKEFMVKDREYRLCGEWPLVKFSDILKYNEVVTDESIVSIKNEYIMKKLKKLTEINNSTPKYFIINDNKKVDIVELLFNIPGVKECMVIAGGYIYEHFLNIMNKDRYRSNKNIDIDCFFYDKKGIEVLQKIITYFKSTNLKITYSKNEYVYNISIIREDERGYRQTLILQFITKIFSSKSSIIGQFDITSSSVLYDGNEMLFTPMAAFSYGTLYNYVDPTRASPTYEYRLNKYMNIKNGFGIAFPEANKDPGLINDLTSYPDFHMYFSNIKRRCGFLMQDDIYSESIYGQFINVSGLCRLYSTNKLNKVYFVVNDNDKCCANYDAIREFYSNKIPSLGTTIINLERYYRKDTVNSLLRAYADYTFPRPYEKKVSEKYVKDMISDIDDYLYKTYNKSPGIVWIEEGNSKNPLGPKPIIPSDFYGEYYKSF